MFDQGQLKLLISLVKHFCHVCSVKPVTKVLLSLLMEFLKPEFCCFRSFLMQMKIVTKTMAKAENENTPTMTLFLPFELFAGLAWKRVK